MADKVSTTLYDAAFLITLWPPMVLIDMITPKETPTERLFLVGTVLGILLLPLTCPAALPILIMAKIVSLFERDD